MEKKIAQKGFTTIELVIVIAVIAILATVLIPTFSDLIKKAKYSAHLSNANALCQSWLVENAANLKSDTVLALVVGESGSEVVYLFANNQLSKEPISPCELPCKAVVVRANGTTALPTGFTLDSHTNTADKDALCTACGSAHTHSFEGSSGKCACETEHEHNFDGDDGYPRQFCICGKEHPHDFSEYENMCACGIQG